MTMYKIDFEALNDARDFCHLKSVDAGWWHTRAGRLLPAETIPDVVACKFALIHSEISEALEGYRKDKQDDHLPDLKSVDVELADALIRIFDLAGYLGCDLATAVERKMAYNQTRKDHTPEARAAVGGKKF